MAIIRGFIPRRSIIAPVHLSTPVSIVCVPPHIEGGVHPVNGGKLVPLIHYAYPCARLGGTAHKLAQGSRFPPPGGRAKSVLAKPDAATAEYAASISPRKTAGIRSAREVKFLKPLTSLFFITAAAHAYSYAAIAYVPLSKLVQNCVQRRACRLFKHGKDVMRRDRAPAHIVPAPHESTVAHRPARRRISSAGMYARTASDLYSPSGKAQAQAP